MDFSDKEMRQRYPTMFPKQMPGDIVYHEHDQATANPLVDENNLAVVKSQAEAELKQAQQTVSMVNEIDRLRNVCHSHYERAEAQMRRADQANAERADLLAAGAAERMRRDGLQRKLDEANTIANTHKLAAEALAQKLKKARKK